MSYWIWKNSQQDHLVASEKANESFRNLFFQSLEDGQPEGIWRPPVDVYEEGNSITVVAELPGVERDNITIQVEKNKLVLFGMRVINNDVIKEKCYRLELAYGKFCRIFELSCEVDEEGIEVKLENGVLSITLYLR